MPQMPQGTVEELTDLELREILEDPTFTPDLIGKMTPGEQARFQILQRRAEIPDAARQIGLAPPPTTSGPATLGTGMEKLFVPQGDAESLYALPMSLAGAFIPPPAKYLTAPVMTGIGGAIGAAVDDPDPLNILGGMFRQGFLELAGKGLKGPAARGLAKQAMGGEITDDAAKVFLGPRRKLSLRDPLSWIDRRAVGRSAPAAERVRLRSGQDIGQRVADLPPGPRIYTRDLLRDVPAIKRELVAKSTTPRDMSRAINKEIRDILTQNPPVITAKRAQAIKQGTREGFESLQRKHVQNAPITPPTRVQESIGNNAQRELEALDDAWRLGSSAKQQPGLSQLRQYTTPSLKALNKRAGGAIDLSKAFAEGKHRLGPKALTRFFQGGLAGSLAATPIQAAMDPGSADLETLQRYSWPGVATGLAWALAPGGVARGVQFAGKMLPNTIRAGAAAPGIYDALFAPEDPLPPTPVRRRTP